MKILVFSLSAFIILLTGCGTFDTSHPSSALVHTPEGLYTVSSDGETIYCFKFNQAGELFYERSFSVSEGEAHELMETAQSHTMAVGDTLQQVLEVKACRFPPSEMIFTGTEAYTVSPDRKTVYCFRQDEGGKLAFHKSVKAE
jgi:hypothetical protein